MSKQPNYLSADARAWLRRHGAISLRRALADANPAAAVQRIRERLESMGPPAPEGLRLAYLWLPRLAPLTPVERLLGRAPRVLGRELAACVAYRRVDRQGPSEAEGRDGGDTFHFGASSVHPLDLARGRLSRARGRDIAVERLLSDPAVLNVPAGTKLHEALRRFLEAIAKSPHAQRKSVLVAAAKGYLEHTAKKD